MSDPTPARPTQEHETGGVIFLAAPVGMHGTPAYAEAVAFLHDRHPDSRVVPDAGMWEDSRHWRETYRTVLADLGVTDLYVLTAPDGTVGRGIFDMWRFLVNEQGVAACSALFSMSGEELSPFELRVIDRDNWTRYAVPVAREDD